MLKDTFFCNLKENTTLKINLNQKTKLINEREQKDYKLAFFDISLPVISDFPGHFPWMCYMQSQHKGGATIQILE